MEDEKKEDDVKIPVEEVKAEVEKNQAHDASTCSHQKEYTALGLQREKYSKLSVYAGEMSYTGIGIIASGLVFDDRGHTLTGLVVYFILKLAKVALRVKADRINAKMDAVVKDHEAGMQAGFQQFAANMLRDVAARRGRVVKVEEPKVN